MRGGTPESARIHTNTAVAVLFDRFAFAGLSRSCESGRSQPMADLRPRARARADTPSPSQRFAEICRALVAPGRARTQIEAHRSTIKTLETHMATAPARKPSTPKPLPTPNSDFYQFAETLSADELAILKRV